MTHLRHHLRTLLVALTAIAGTVSMACGVAASIGGDASRTSPRECCLDRVCNTCCCEPAADEGRPGSTGTRVELPPHAGRFAAPARPCGCRSGEPTSPASRPESRPVEDRPDTDRSPSATSTVPAPAAVAFARPIPPDVSPPKSPLYLRTSRLLI